MLVKEIGDGSTGLAYDIDLGERTAATVLNGDNRAVMMAGMTSKKKQELSPSDSTEYICSIVKTETFEVKSETVLQQKKSASSIEEDTW